MESRKSRTGRPVAWAGALALMLGLAVGAPLPAHATPSTYPTVAYAAIQRIEMPEVANQIATGDDTVWVSLDTSPPVIMPLNPRSGSFVGAGITLDDPSYAMAATDDTLFALLDNQSTSQLRLASVDPSRTVGTVDDSVPVAVSGAGTGYTMTTTGSGDVYVPLEVGPRVVLAHYSGNMSLDDTAIIPQANIYRIFNIAASDDSAFVPVGDDTKLAILGASNLDDSAYVTLPTVIRSVNNGARSAALASNGHVFVTGSSTSTMDIIDPQTRSSVRTVTGLAGTNAMGLSLSRDDTAYVVTRHFPDSIVSIVDPSSPVVDDTVFLAGIIGSFSAHWRGGVTYVADSFNGGNGFALYAVAPVSGSLSAASGTAGSSLSATFVAPSSVPFDDSAVTAISLDGTAVPATRSGSTWSFTVPAGSGTVDVTAALNGGNTISLGSFTYGSPSPPQPDPVYPPGAPSDVVGVAGDRSVTVSWSAPASQGSFPVSMYKVSASPGGGSCLTTVPSTSCTVTGLTNGTAYTFSVVALNGAGWGPAGTTGPVTPGGVTPAPEPQPLPAPLDPGESSLIVNGVPDPNVKVDPKPTDKGVTITASDFEMDLDGLDGLGQPKELSPEGVLILDEQREVQTSGRGFRGNSEVDLYMDPPVAAGPASRSSRAGSAIYVGTVKTTASGTFAGQVTLPDSIAAGDHVLQAVGFSQQAQPRAMSLGVRVTPSLTLLQGTRSADGRHDRIRTSGNATGIDAGVKLTPYIKYSGQSAFSQGKATIVVRDDGTFTWTRQIRKGKTLTAYVAYTDITSNEVVWLKLK